MTERKSIPPLIKCQWGQYSPYNKRLVFDKKKHLVGCNAIAIAQIMFYWMIQRGYHRGCKATPKYTTATNKLAVEPLPPITTFDFHNLVPNPKSTAEKNAVATLCEYIAKALRSDFGQNLTGAKRTIIDTTINSYLRLGNAKHAYQSTIGKAEFDRILYEEIAQGRPVILTGQSTKSGGHTFLVDGYQAENSQYHINWGWDGQFDGYYPLNSLTPDGENYNSSKMMVYNIQPLYKLGDTNGDGSITIADVMNTINTANSNKSTKETDINSDGKTTIEDANIIAQHITKGGIL